jgi:enoyl-CoA hydratase/carnithine racemase
MLRSELVDEEFGIVRITLDRPEVKNALSLALLKALSSSLESLSIRNDVHAIILAHSGDVFCAGGDLRELGTRLTHDDAEALAASGLRVVHAIRELRKPVICALSGKACDFRVMTQSAAFEFRHVKLGATTAWASARRLIALVGRGHANSILMRAKTVSIKDAVALGLAESESQVDGDANALALTLARELAGLPALALARTKQNIRSEDAGTEHESFLTTWPSTEHEEALHSVMAIRATLAAKTTKSMANKDKVE